MRPNVEDAVGAYSSGGAVVQVEEPDGAVHQREPYGKQSVNRSDGQPVEGELGGLLGGLGYLPDDIGHRHRCQCDGQEPTRTGTAYNQAAPQEHFNRKVLEYADGLALPAHRLSLDSTGSAWVPTPCNPGSPRSSRPGAAPRRRRWIGRQPRPCRRSCSCPLWSRSR